MALLTYRDSRQEYVGGVVAFGGACMAGRARHHAMRVVVKLSMKQPARGDIRFRYFRESSGAEIESVALFAGLGP